MQRADASRILKQVWSRWSGDSFASVPTEDMDNMRLWLSMRIRQAWQYQNWPDLKRCEKRHFRDVWSRFGPVLDENKSPIVEDGEFVYIEKLWDLGDECYYPPTGKYYRSLQANHTTAPADANGLLNASYWSELAATYSGDNWAASTDYVAGDHVFNPETNYFYQCITDHTSTDAFDYDKFVYIDAFERYVQLEQFGETEIGTIFSIWDKNPRVDKSASAVPFETSEHGPVVTKTLSAVWIEFKVAVPDLPLVDYDATAAYAGGERVYFTTAAGAGNWYKCVASTVAGYSPESQPSFWELVEIPRVFEGFLAMAVLADAYASDGKHEASDKAETTAGELLDNEAFAAVTQQGQANTRSVYVP